MPDPVAPDSPASGPRRPPPMWLPWLGPLLAAGIGAAVGQYGLGGGFWTVLAAALVGGFAPIVAYRVWKRMHHR